MNTNTFQQNQVESQQSSLKNQCDYKLNCYQNDDLYFQYQSPVSEMSTFTSDWKYDDISQFQFNQGRYIYDNQYNQPNSGYDKADYEQREDLWMFQKQEEEEQNNNHGDDQYQQNNFYEIFIAPQQNCNTECNKNQIDQEFLYQQEQNELIKLNSQQQIQTQSNEEEIKHCTEEIRQNKQQKVVSSDRIQKRKEKQNKEISFQKNFLKNITQGFLNYMQSNRDKLELYIQSQSIEPSYFFKKYLPKNNKITHYTKFVQFFTAAKNKKVNLAHEKYILRILALKFLRTEYLQFFYSKSRVENIDMYIKAKHEYQLLLQNLQFSLVKEDQHNKKINIKEEYNPDL